MQDMCKNKLFSYSIIDQVIQSVQSLSHVWFFETPWSAACQASLSIKNSQSLLKLMSWVSDAIQPSHPLSSPSPSTINVSQDQGLFQGVSSSHEVAEVLEFQLQHQSFRWTPWTGLLQDGLVVSPCSPRDSQDLLQHHSSKASILRCSGFFIVKLTSIHDYWKNHGFD